MPYLFNSVLGGKMLGVGKHLQGGSVAASHFQGAPLRINSKGIPV